MHAAIRKRVPSAIDAHVGQRIRNRRRELGIAQTKLAGLIGVSYQQVQKYERGLDQVAPLRLAAIAEALEVSSGFFFPAPNGTRSKPYDPVLSCLAAAQAASEAVSELVRVAREGKPLPVTRCSGA